MDSVMYTPKNYGPAIYLALNHSAGGLEVHDYIYNEDMDLWYVECSERGFDVAALQLEGKFVRSCYKATKEGVTSWTETKVV